MHFYYKTNVSFVLNVLLKFIWTEKLIKPNRVEKVWEFFDTLMTLDRICNYPCVDIR